MGHINLNIFLFAFFLINTGAIQAYNLSFNGYIKSYALFLDDISLDNSRNAIPEEFDSGFQSQNALRLMANAIDTTRGNFEIHYEIQPIYYSNPALADQAGKGFATLSTGSTIYRYKDLNPILNQYDDNAVILQNLDRFNYQYSNEQGDLTIGRQVVSFGSSRFINPTDIFIPFNIQTLNQEYRVGIDAARYQAALGDFSVLDMGIIIGEDADKENSAIFLRGKKTLYTNDIELISIILNNALLLGGGLERSISDFGFWFETAYMHLNNNETNNYWRTSIGTDFSFNTNVITSIEYHYNGAGSDNPDDYIQLINSYAYQNAGVFLLGEHYIIPTISWQFNPLITINASGFFNLSDQSIFINLSGDISWTDNLYSDFGTYLSHGDSLETQASPPQINIGSEFGAYPVSLYASLKYYF